MLRINDIKLSLDSDEKELNLIVSKRLRIDKGLIKELKIYKKSIDARDKNNIHFVYTVDVKVDNENRFKKFNIIEDKINNERLSLNTKSTKRPVIVGAGPAGLFSAIILAKYGLKPIILEQGKKVDERKKDVDLFWQTGELNPLSNVQFGEGGAGTFSDGKLTTQISNPLCREVLQEFVLCGAPEEILYDSKPHIGTDILINVVKNMREKVENLGGEFLFNEKLIDLDIKDNKVVGVKCSKYIETDTLILAIGHSSRDTFEMLYSKGISMCKKPFSVGVRIEHLQSMINESQYGKFAKHLKLGAADYKLVYHNKVEDRSAYTFCMCPGGQVVAAASEIGGVVTNGMSLHSRNGINSNSALLVTISPEDFKDESPLAGMYFQRELEQKAFEVAGRTYNAPTQLVGDFLNSVKSTSIGKISSTYIPGITLCDLHDVLPDFVTKVLKEAIIDMDKRLKGFADKDALLVGVETRSSSPLRIIRNENLMSNIYGIYPCGEGAGYAGGIMSSAVDGIKCASAIIEEK